MIDRVYAKFTMPYKGLAWDVEKGRSAKLIKGKRYIVEAFIIGDKYTDIWIPQVIFPLDSSHFILEDKNGDPVNIKDVKNLN